MDIKDMLTAYNLNPDNDAIKSFFERDNIWKILDIQRYEPSHSAFLVWFFNQKIAQYSHIRYLLNLLIHSADLIRNLIKCSLKVFDYFLLL